MHQELKLLLDENIGIKVYEELKRHGIKVQSVIIEKRGASDEEIVEIAKKHGKIIVTMDKDFGYIALSHKPPGLILLRLNDPKIQNRLHAILKVLELRAELYGYITIISETIIRRRPIEPQS